jgi:ribosomal protein L29
MKEKESKSEYFKVRSVKHVVKLLEQTINQVRNDEIDQKKANAIGYLSNQIIRAIESSELEKRMIELEKKVLHYEKHPLKQNQQT